MAQRRGRRYTQRDREDSEEMEDYSSPRIARYDQERQKMINKNYRAVQEIQAEDELRTPETRRAFEREYPLRYRWIEELNAEMGQDRPSLDKSLDESLDLYVPKYAGPQTSRPSRPVRYSRSSKVTRSRASSPMPGLRASIPRDPRTGRFISRRSY